MNEYQWTQADRTPELDQEANDYGEALEIQKENYLEIASDFITVKLFLDWIVEYKVQYLLPLENNPSNEILAGMIYQAIKQLDLILKYCNK
jgi:hypothetical protein